MELLPKFWLRLRQSYCTLLYFLLGMFLFSCKSSITDASSTGNETDRLALLAFKEKITEDPFNIMNSWNDSVHFCNWQGVSCSERHHGRVTVLNLEGRKLAGTLPPHIGNLSFLREISLNENFFRGEIPHKMGRLLRLRTLNLSSNGFEGEIPSSLSNCSNLQAINLNYNKLNGEIPFELRFLSKNLRKLGVVANNLTGSIPIWLGNATSLMLLSLAENNFQGTIPSELGRLTNLGHLTIYGNNISGTVPPSIYNLSSLIILDIADNKLHGRIPSDVGSTLFNLLGLYVAGNYFSGSLPISLPNASGLAILSFASNNFTGTVPLNLGSLKDLRRLSVASNYLENEDGRELSFLTSLTNCSKLQILAIEYNMFRGELPSSIANFSDALEMLSAGSNQISGTIPEGIEALVGLQYFLIFENMITGKIPTGISKHKNLRYISLYHNRVSGAIPSSFGNMTQLLRLELTKNHLEGNIPPSLGSCQQLEILSLSVNKLTGVIPKEIVSLTSIHVLDLSQNFLTGKLPPEVGNMSKLVKLDVSKNMLSGEIPSSIGGCEMLEQLLLGDNSFEGRIPSTLSNLKSINAIDLSKNNLSGQIPAYLQNFITFLQHLNLSYNNFEGEVPQEGIFINLSAFSIVGNAKLCGGLKTLGLLACQVDVQKRNGVSLVLKIAIPIAISCSILLASLLLVVLRRKKTRAKSSSKDLLDEHFPKVSYAELSQATNKFSSSNLIGRGSHGSVYRGILSNLGMTVAVKVLNLMQKGAAKSFMAESNALRNIRHRNLLKIITACSSIDFKGDDFKALIFEFMPNGSLEEWLHHSENSQLRHENLSLTLRLSIATDIASALEYLHHHCETPVVHGDLKPSNILLDHEMTAHVGDFGLARVLSYYLSENSSQNPMSSTSVKGTVGYVAPEYGMGAMLSQQGDIYSFGIMLLEIFTGRRPTDDIFKNDMDLHQHVKMALPKGVREIVEPSIRLDFEVEANGSNNVETRAAKIKKTMECVAAILRVGVSCSMQSPGERMSMKDVVQEMNKIKDKYTGIRNRNEGSILIWLGNTTSLMVLYLDDNNFQGTISSELGRLMNLRDLVITGNNISGTVPPSIYNLSSLQYLDIGSNKLHGRIPSDVGSTLFNLLWLSVGRNYFSGSLPISLPNASGLVDLDFSSNNFTGTVPLNLGSLKDLSRLILGSNYMENEDGVSYQVQLPIFQTHLRCYQQDQTRYRVPFLKELRPLLVCNIL